MSDIQVIKRGGSLETFSADKISRVSQAAGLEPDQAKQLAAEISDWVNNQPSKTVSSIQIRDQVISGMKKYNLMAANMYQWYDKTKK